MMTKIVMYSLLPIALGAVSPTDLLLRKRQLMGEPEAVKNIRDTIKGILAGEDIPTQILDIFLDKINISAESALSLTNTDDVITYLVDKANLPKSCVDLVNVESGSREPSAVATCAKEFSVRALSEGALVEALSDEKNKSYAFVLKVLAPLNFGVFIFPSLVRGLPLGKTLSRGFLWVGEAFSDLTTFVWTWIAVYLGGESRVHYLSLAIVSMVIAILKRVVSFIPFLSGIAKSLVFTPLAFWVNLITVIVTQYVPLYFLLDVQRTVKSIVAVKPVAVKPVA